MICTPSNIDEQRHEDTHTEVFRLVPQDWSQKDCADYFGYECYGDEDNDCADYFGYEWDGDEDNEFLPQRQRHTNMNKIQNFETLPTYNRFEALQCSSDDFMVEDSEIVDSCQNMALDILTDLISTIVNQQKVGSKVVKRLRKREKNICENDEDKILVKDLSKNTNDNVQEQNSKEGNIGQNIIRKEYFQKKKCSIQLQIFSQNRVLQ